MIESFEDSFLRFHSSLARYDTPPPMGYSVDPPRLLLPWLDRKRNVSLFIIHTDGILGLGKVLPCNGWCNIRSVRNEKNKVWFVDLQSDRRPRCDTGFVPFVICLSSEDKAFHNSERSTSCLELASLPRF